MCRQSRRVWERSNSARNRRREAAGHSGGGCGGGTHFSCLQNSDSISCTSASRAAASVMLAGRALKNSPTLEEYSKVPRRAQSKEGEVQAWGTYCRQLPPRMDWRKDWKSCGRRRAVERGW